MVVNKFYGLLTPEPAVNANHAFGKYHRFKQLQRLADSEYQHLFQVSHTLHPDYSLVFKIDDVEIYRDTQCEVWQSLSELTSHSRPLIENYTDIVKNTALDNKEAFTLAYPESEITSCYGADQLMDYSCFYLQNNAHLKQTLQDYGLGCEKTASFIIEEMCEKMRFDDRLGTMEYALITIASTLKYFSENERS